MAQPAVPSSMTLSVEVYRQIARDYKIQHGIDIRINGGDDNPVLQQEQRMWLQEKTQGLEGDRAAVSVAKTIYRKLSPEDRKAYLADVGAFLHFPDGEVVEADAKVFSATINHSPRWKGIFDAKISSALGKLAAKAQTVGLALGQSAQTIIDLIPQAATPIAFLRPSLDNRLTGVTTGPSHMAGFIITQRLVIGIAGDEPEIYVAAAICPSLRYAETNLSSFILEPKKGPPPRQTIRSRRRSADLATPKASEIRPSPKSPRREARGTTSAKPACQFSRNTLAPVVLRLSMSR